MQNRKTPTISPEAYTFLESLYTDVIYAPQEDGQFGMMMKKKKNEDGTAEAIESHPPVRLGTCSDLNAASFQLIDAMMEAATIWGAMTEKFPMLQNLDLGQMKQFFMQTAKGFIKKYDAEHGTTNGEWQNDHKQYYDVMGDYINEKLMDFAGGAMCAFNYDLDKVRSDADAEILADVAKMFSGLFGATGDE